MKIKIILGLLLLGSILPGFAQKKALTEYVNNIPEGRNILIQPQIHNDGHITGKITIDFTINKKGDVISAHHILSRTPPPHGPEALDEDALDRWAEAHSAFHEVLFAACTNGRLLRIVKQLAEEAAMYRRWSVALVLHNPRGEAEHQALLESALAGDWERGSAVLKTHIEHTREMLANYVAAHPDA